MKRQSPWFAALLLVGAIGCSKSDTPPAEKAPASEAGASANAAAADEAAGAKTYGEPLGDSPEVSLANLLAKPEDFADKSVRTKGHVRQACTKKGCWMEVAAGPADDAPATRVTFKDYGFFVPTDSAGTKAVLEGEVVIKTIDADDVEHLEAEGATFVAKADDGSAREVQFVASGVELAR